MWDYVFSYCRDLKSITVSESNPVFCLVDGVLFSKNQRILYNYPCSKAGSVREICCTAFAFCFGLTDVYLDSPSAVWYTYTFYNDTQMTVYYLPLGASQNRADNFIKNGLTAEAGAPLAAGQRAGTPIRRCKRRWHGGRPRSGAPGPVYGGRKRRSG